MPSKRTFARRLAALAATGLGVGPPIDALVDEPSPARALGADPETTRTDAAVSDSSGSAAEADESRSAVAAGRYDPAAPTSRSVEAVVTGRIDPAVLAATGLPSGLETRLQRLLSRYDAVSLDAVRRVDGRAALTAHGPEGCAVAVGDVDAAALAAELDADPETVRDAGDGAFARFRSRAVGSAVAVAPNEVVAAHGPTAAAAAAHRDAGIDGGRRRTGATADYGPLPSLLRGDAAVCVDLGPDARDRLADALADAPDELRVAVGASTAVGASLRVTEDGALDDTGTGDGDGPSVALRYGAVADPRRLNRETVETLAAAARDEGALSEATVTRRGRTFLVDAVAGSDLVAAHADLVGAAVGDVTEAGGA